MIGFVWSFPPVIDPNSFGLVIVRELNICRKCNFFILFLKDFHQFACGGFLKTKIIPDDESNWDVFDIITKEIEYKGRQLLEEAIDDKKDFESYKKAKRFYKSCMNEEQRNELGLEPLRQILMKIGGWPVLEGT